MITQNTCLAAQYASQGNGVCAAGDRNLQIRQDLVILSKWQQQTDSVANMIYLQQKMSRENNKKQIDNLRNVGNIDGIFGSHLLR